MAGEQTLAAAAAALACSSLPLACVSASSSSSLRTRRPSARPLVLSFGSPFSFLRPPDCCPRRRRPEFSDLRSARKFFRKKLIFRSREMQPSNRVDFQIACPFLFFYFLNFFIKMPCRPPCPCRTLHSARCRCVTLPS